MNMRITMRNKLARVVLSSAVTALFTTLLCAIPLSYAVVENSISVNVNQDLGAVNRGVLGNNMLGASKGWNDTVHYFNSSENQIAGQGVWDPIYNQSVAGMVALAKDVGMSDYPWRPRPHHPELLHPCIPSQAPVRPLSGWIFPNSTHRQPSGTAPDHNIGGNTCSRDNPSTNPRILKRRCTRAANTREVLCVAVDSFSWPR